MIFKTLAKCARFSLAATVVGSCSTFFVSSLWAAETPRPTTAVNQEATEVKTVATAPAPKKDPVVDLAVDLPHDPYELVKVVTDRLVKKLERYQSLESEAERDAFSREVVEQTFAVMVDFDLIARRVMAKHYTYATKTQREAFARVFRESLINTYASAMSAYTNQKIVIQPFSGVDAEGSRRRAKVGMEIHGTSGEVYPVEYALYETPDGRWMLENLILNGVNIGLTFRNQFNEALRQQKGSIDTVIDTWSSKVSSL